MSILSWGYLILSFFEPSCSKQEVDKNSSNFKFIYSIEVIILILFWTDLIADFFHRYFNDSKTLIESYIKNQKFFWKFVINIAFLIDSITFFNFTDQKFFRFSKILRPCLI